MMRPIALALAALLAAITPWAGGAGTARGADAPLAGIVIAVDPGHDGGNASHRAQISRLVFVGNGRKACNTVGTATRGGYAEHRFTWSVALRVKARLEALGATVYLTRTSDTGVGPCVDVRGRFGARVHANLMISIHGNGAASADHGFFVMRPGRIAGYTDDITTSSARLAKAVRGGLVSAGVPVANYYAPAGIKVRTDLGTLNMSNVPVVMVELGNMKNAADAHRMTSSAGRGTYAAGLVAGVRAYLGR